MVPHILFAVLQKLPPELAHNVALNFLQYKYISHMVLQKPARAANIGLSVFNDSYISPIGIAAGFDKNAQSLPSLPYLACGFIEVGTITPKAQYGNPKPRLFRVVSAKSVINAMGFPNKGMAAIMPHIKRFRAKDSAQKIWVNIGPNKDSADVIADYVTLAKAFYNNADALVINVSSPNTANLRQYQAPEKVISIINAIKPHIGNCPLCIKFAPDNAKQQLQEMALAAYEHGISAITIGNTTTMRPDVLDAKMQQQKGGLSGALLRDMAHEKCAEVAEVIDGKIPIIGVGGISTYQDVLTRMRMGASMVQLYSALIYAGPSLLEQLEQGLSTFLQQNNMTLDELMEHKNNV